MAAPVNTATTLTQVGGREDLEDVINRVAPEDTPFYSNIGTSTAAKATYHEWQTEALGTPTADNATLEGDDTTDFEQNITTRVGNHTQILKHAFVVSGTQEKVDKAGRKSELGRQRRIWGIEVKRDKEATLLSNNASTPEAGGNPRKAAGIQAWLETNVSLGAGGATGGFAATPGNTLVAAATPGTVRPFSRDQVDEVMQSCFDESGSSKNRQMYLSSGLKRTFSTFVGITELRTDANSGKQASIVGAAEAYTSDFGMVRTIPVAYGLTDSVLLIDPSKVGVSTLRPMMTERLAKTGDNEKHHILCEKTLVVDNEKAHGVIHAVE